MVLSLVKCTVIDLRRRLREVGRCTSSLLQPAVVTLGDLPEHTRKAEIITRATVKEKTDLISWLHPSPIASLCPRSLGI